jgi:hypothetical protein
VDCVKDRATIAPVINSSVQRKDVTVWRENSATSLAVTMYPTLGEAREREESGEGTEKGAKGGGDII